eukprot:m.203539 g.203539  ORF g.203539 m.203539 type:complete len:494 (-) comp22148_c0_seq1:61-1542(-)
MSVVAKKSIARAPCVSATTVMSGESEPVCGLTSLPKVIGSRALQRPTVVVATSVVLLSALVAPAAVTALDNGVGRTPIMGWMTWQRYRCNVDCVNDPDNCISAALIKTHADLLVSLGLADVGYNYVNIDSCWASMERGPNGELRANASRFPEGIAALADYVHSKGLRLGLYTNMGPHMGDGSPGLNCSSGLCEQARHDIETMASWGIDSIKIDGDMSSDALAMNESYPAVGRYLLAAANTTGRPIVFSCSWPAYTAHRYPVQYRLMAKYCNMWRNYHDIQDNADSLWDIANYWATLYDSRSHIQAGAPMDQFLDAGPGHFNDPDQLLIGQTPCPGSCTAPTCPRGMHCNNISVAEERTQMALWAVIAAPMLMSNDLRAIPKHSLDLLLNKEIIRVSQDALGRQGRRVAVSAAGSAEVWARDLANGDVAIVARNTGNTSSVTVNIPLERCGFANTTRVALRELFHGVDVGIVTMQHSVSVGPHDVAMFRASLAD